MLPSDFSLPAETCDCHVHVFDPTKFPYSPRRVYTPPAARTADLQAFHQQLGVERTVLVQPSCYGTDNGALAAALAELGPGRARGIAVVDVDTVTDEELSRLRALGVRGVRLNFPARGAAQAGRQCQAAAERIAPFGWHLQLHADAPTLALLAPVLQRLPVPVVLDHFGGGPAAAATLAHLLASDHVWMKLSAPYRVCAAFGELHELLRLLLSRTAQRLVWASDWPHTGGNGARAGAPSEVEPFRQVDVAVDLRALRSMVADEPLFHRLMATNPARLYGF